MAGKTQALQVVTLIKVQYLKGVQKNIIAISYTKKCLS